ncbi:MAG TPA: glycosyl hydrolase, partial [Acidimicrobiia bacterium]|nr:glycosyl hydrolase [Acidimicrobiia bacterium]
WVWTANAAGFKDKRKYSNNEPPGPHFYPGDEYVDWIAADGYNWGVSKRNQGDRWRQVLEIFDEFMVFARAHPKPIMFGEYGAQEQREDPEAKPEWMRRAHDVLINKPKTPDCKHCGAFSDVAAVVYFDVDYGPHGDWRIMSSDETLRAYKEASDNPWFHQLDNVSWPPKLNRSQPNRAHEYGPRRKPDDSNASTPPPEETTEEPVPEPEQAPQSEQANQPPDPANQPPDPADQGGGQPPDQTSQPPDQASQPPDQGGRPDQAGRSDRGRQDDSSDQGDDPASAKASQKPEPGRKGKKNR